MQLHSFRCSLAQLIANLKPLRTLVGAIGVILMIVLSSCTSETGASENWWVSQVSSTPIELSISQAEPITNGSYRVSGTTSLPDQTELTVSAVRYFQPGASANSYAILDRTIATVAQGQWDTQLNLWQSVNGQFQEAWQNRFTAAPPQPTVTFLATLEPANQPSNLEEQVEALSPSAQAQLTGFTTDGELYLQASKTIDLASPQIQPVNFKLEPIKTKQVEIISPNSDAAEANRQRSIDMSLPPSQTFQ